MRALLPSTPLRAGALLFSLFLPPSSVGADGLFVRGDTNADGVIDISDPENILDLLFGGAWGGSCMDAFDADDDGGLFIRDAILLLDYILEDGSPPPTPFQAAGRDPTEDRIDCEKTVSYPPIEDGGIVLFADPCTVRAGKSSATILLKVTTEVPINAFQFTPELEDDSLPGPVRFKAGAYSSERNDYVILNISKGNILGFIGDLLARNPVGPGEEIPVLYLIACFPPGTPPGTYTLTLNDPRCGVHEDMSTHIPVALPIEVRVEEPVTSEQCPQVPDSVEPPPPPLTKGEYRISGPWRLIPGAETLTLELNVRSPDPPVSLDIALDYGEYVFKLKEVRDLFQADGRASESFRVTLGPETCRTPVNDAEEGYVALHMELPRGITWEGGKEYPVAEMVFNILRPPESLYGKGKFILRDVGANEKFSNNIFFLENGEIVEARPNLPEEFSVAYPGPEPPVVENLEDVRVTFRLSEAAGIPGADNVPVYFFIESNTAIQGFSAAFLYDKNVLEAQSFDSLVHLSGSEPDFVQTRIWTPPDRDLPWGLTIGVVLDLNGTYRLYPDPEDPVACARFSIREDAPEGTDTDLAFKDGIIGSPKVWNTVVVQGAALPPDGRTGEVRVSRFMNGKVKIMGEVSPFLRADANGDYYVDIADPIFILSYLFGDGPAPRCPDAADANDDGRINIADPVTILYLLFSPYKKLAPPYPAMGRDPTEDELGPCLY